jgi:hypothetical protein
MMNLCFSIESREWLDPMDDSRIEQIILGDAILELLEHIRVIKIVWLRRHADNLEIELVDCIGAEFRSRAPVSSPDLTTQVVSPIDLLHWRHFGPFGRRHSKDCVTLETLRDERPCSG